MQIVRQAIQARQWLRLTEEISVKPGLSFAKGKMESDTDKGKLEFDVIVFDNFPLGKIEIYCTNVSGYQHQMPSGLLCLNTAPAKTAYDRVELELNKLEQWIDRYFVNEVPDIHYEYLHFKNQGNLPVIFEEDVTKPLLKRDCGIFNYTSLNERSIEGIKVVSLIITDIGGRPCRWSKSFLKNLSGKHKGIYIYLTKPPIIQRRETLVNWIDLISLMSEVQAAFLYDEFKNIRKDSFFPGGIIVMIGYDIPGPNGKEIHWETLSILNNEFPYEPKKIANGRYTPHDFGKMILWGRSQNASYERMFGRGKLPNKITDSKILIVGTGAIGSNLFMSLVRGGCRNVDINDGEVIEAGNICRGLFSIKSSFLHKVLELEYEAINVSPYLEVKAGVAIMPLSRSQKQNAETQSQLMEYDYIFDCTTDKYLSIMFDEMELRGDVINFSISNEAQHFVVVTGKKNVHLIKNDIYSKLPNDEEPFYVATGCFHPTFKASFSDINVLLHYAINEICNKTNRGIPLSTFIISKREDDMKNLKYDISYNV